MHVHSTIATVVGSIPGRSIKSVLEFFGGAKRCCINLLDKQGWLAGGGNRRFRSGRGGGVVIYFTVYEK